MLVVHDKKKSLLEEEHNERQQASSKVNCSACSAKELGMRTHERSERIYEELQS